MFLYILNRVASAAIVLLLISVIVFTLLKLAPGDPAVLLAGELATPEQIQAVRAEFGLDRPFVVQFLAWLSHVLQGDLGRSLYLSDQPVTELIAQRLGPSVSLAITTLMISVPIAVPLGVLAAAKAGRPADKAVMFFAVVTFSMPIFVVGYALIWAFALELRWFPTQGFVPLTRGFFPFLRSITLASIALGLIYIALVARITRATVIETLREDYIRTARAKGASEFIVVSKHALSNAAVPIITIITVGFTALLGGVVVTETVFNIPGLGRLIVDALLRRDYPVIQGTLLVVAAANVLVNLVADISYSFLDPRIKLMQASS
jgi:peptide/nickel transport system permease protein